MSPLEGLCSLRGLAPGRPVVLVLELGYDPAVQRFIDHSLASAHYLKVLLLLPYRLVNKRAEIRINLLPRGWCEVSAGLDYLSLPVLI